MKYLSIGSKIAAYNSAIEHLKSEELASDEEDDVDARKWLADKLDKECDKWFSNLKKTGNEQS